MSHVQSLPPGSFHVEGGWTWAKATVRWGAGCWVLHMEALAAPLGQACGVRKTPSGVASKLSLERQIPARWGGG